MKAGNRDNKTADSKLDDSGLDLESLRLSQDFAQQIDVKTLLNRVPTRKPHRQEFIQVRNEEEYRADMGLIELKDDREYYLLGHAVMSELPDEWIPARLYTAINRQNVLFIWPCKLPLPDGRSNAWYDTAHQAAERAMKGWIKIVADMHLGGYRIYEPQIQLPDPEWPDYPLSKIVEIAFRDRFIRSMDHPVVRRLLGLE